MTRIVLLVSTEIGAMDTKSIINHLSWLSFLFLCDTNSVENRTRISFFHFFPPLFLPPLSERLSPLTSGQLDLDFWPNQLILSTSYFCYCSIYLNSFSECLDMYFILYSILKTFDTWYIREREDMSMIRSEVNVSKSCWKDIHGSNRHFMS